MSRGINKVIVVGNLGADPVVKYMPSGAAVCNLSVATTEHWKDKETGEKKERTEWHRISVFGKLGEIAGEYLRKGSQVYIEGKLRTRDYMKDGQKHYSTEIIADEMQMLGRPAHGGQGGYASQGNSAPAHRGQAPQQEEAFVDDDIPF